ncbi:hypothetical protein [Polaromonas sp. CG9_12]|nr:hypothetical protein [Polaromonas sp. CG9_12]
MKKVFCAYCVSTFSYVLSSKYRRHSVDCLYAMVKVQGDFF